MFKHATILLALMGAITSSAQAQTKTEALTPTRDPASAKAGRQSLPPPPDKGSLPPVAFYRLWSGRGASHFYTTKCAELAVIPKTYAVERIEGYLSQKPGPEEVPLHRYWNGSISDQFHTTNQREVPEKSGYVYEGIAGYIGTKPGEGRKPLYRYWNGGISDHFYTTNAGEIGTITLGQTGNQGYIFEGIVGYVWTTGQDCKNDEAPPATWGQRVKPAYDNRNRY